ncbi:unnamed protein product, partial [marine sediment metagenome]
FALGEEDAALQQEIFQFGMRLGEAVANGDAAMWLGPMVEGSVFGMGMGGVSVGFGPGRKQDTGVALLPRAPQLVLPVSAPALCLSSASEQRKDAWKWINFMLEKTPPLGLPVRVSLLTGAEEVLAQPEHAAVAQALGEHVQEAVCLPAFNVAAQRVGTAIWKTWEGEPLDEVLAEAAERLESDLEARAKRRTQGE